MIFDRPLLFSIPLLLVIGCSDAQNGAASSSSAAAAAAKPGASSVPATKPTGDAPGSFSNPITVDKELITCAWTKAYATNSFNEQAPEIECKNLSDKDMNYVQMNIYYYDKDKKILNGGPMSSSENGSPIMKAGETKKFAAGKKKDEIPGVVTIQVEVSAGSYGDGTQWKNLQKPIDLAELIHALKDLPKDSKEFLENAKKAYRSYQNGYKGVAAVRATAMGQGAYKSASEIWEKASKLGGGE